MMYRQGDLLFIETAKEPHGVLKQGRGRLDILGSSVTGHTHRLSAGLVYVNPEPTWERRENFFVDLPKGADVLHEEHATIPLPAGRYLVIRQRETTGYVRD